MLIEHVVQVNPNSIIASVPVCSTKELKRTVCLMDEQQDRHASENV